MSPHDPIFISPEVPLSSDIVLPFLKAKLRKFKLSSYNAFSLDYELEAMTFRNPPPGGHYLLSKRGRPVGYRQYCLVVASQEIHVFFRLNDNGRPRALHRRGHHGTWGWVNFERYLNLLRLPDTNPHQTSLGWVQTRAICRIVQQEWWKQNGKSFNLLKLPAELRDLIYKHALSGQIDPYPTAKCRRLGRYQFEILSRQPTFNLLKVNRQVHDEASDILSLHGDFFFEHFSILKNFVQRIDRWANLKQVRLSLSHDAYLDLFGIWIPEEENQRVGFKNLYPDVSLRRKFAKISPNALDFDFRSPTETGHNILLDGACQTTVVNLILQAANECIGGQPVKLTGHIKESQKAGFYQKNERVRKEIAAWQKVNVAAGLEQGSRSDYFRESELEDMEEGGVLLEPVEPEDVVSPEEGPPNLLKIINIHDFLRCVHLSGGPPEGCAPGVWCDRE